MRSDPAAAIDSASAFALGKSVVYRYPLLGEYEPSPAEMDMLMNAAQDVFQKMTLEHAELTFEEQAVLTFTTIQLLKNWTTDGAEVPDDSEDGASDNGFWNYIYLQNTGWIAVKISFSGGKWNFTDTTFAAGGVTPAESGYTTLRVY